MLAINASRFSTDLESKTVMLIPVKHLVKSKKKNKRVPAQLRTGLQAMSASTSEQRKVLQLVAVMVMPMALV